MVQAFLKKWWVESDFKAPILPLSLRLKVSGCHYNSIYNNTCTKLSEVNVKDTFTSHIDKNIFLTFLLKPYLYTFSLYENPSFIIFSVETEFKFYQIKTSEYLNFFIWKKKFHEEPNITICSQVSDTWTGRAFFTTFVFFFKFLC